MRVLTARLSTGLFLLLALVWGLAGCDRDHAGEEPAALAASEHNSAAPVPDNPPAPAAALAPAPQPQPVAPPDPPPPPPPPDPWEGGSCRVLYGLDVHAVHCRDLEAARLHAETHGEPLPTPAAGPEGFSDPVAAKDGLAIHDHTLRRLVSHARVTPTVFFAVPPYSAEEWAHFAKHKSQWAQAREYWGNPDKQDSMFRRAWRAARKGNEEQLRRLVLRNGYLFTQNRRVARRIYKALRMDMLFSDKTIYLQRGDQVFRLIRKGRRGYYHDDGPMTGRRATILPFDRVAVSQEALATNWHWDLDGARRAVGLGPLDVEELARPVVPFKSTFLSGEDVEGFIFRKEGRTALVLAGDVPEVMAERVERNRTQQHAKDLIIDAAEQFADEWIRFDEPDIEFGQQDGILRDAWEEAYLAGKTEYEVNGVSYRVFGGGGHPIPPQVCIDFLMDAVERASGTWWRYRGKGRPRRTHGTVDWRGFDGLKARSVQSLIAFAKRNPDIFSVYAVPPERQVKFEKRSRFFDNLRNFPVDFRRGDIIVIWGYREDERRHFHSFFVHSIDPIRGFPIVLADNAGLAALRVWYDVMKTAPRRYVYYRLRLRDQWLLDRGIGAPRESGEEAAP